MSAVRGLPGLAVAQLGVRGCQMRDEFLPDGLGDRRSVVLEARKPGTQGAFTRRTELPADRVVVLQIERAQERLERQSLDRRACRARRQNAVSTIRSRNGNAAGSASAAASVTMPRMPAHEMTRPLPTVGRSIGRGG